MIRAPGAGPAHARNLGATVARGEILVFLDAHCFPSRGWLQPLVDGVRRHPADIFTGVISAAGETGMRGCGQTLVNAGFDIEWLALAADGAEVPLAGSALMAISAARYFAIGGFYRFASIGLEDIELSIRQWLLGGRIRFAADSHVAHLFAGPWRAGVARTAHLQNALTLAHLHLDGERLDKSLRWFAQWPEFVSTHTRLRERGVFNDRDRLAAKRTMTFDEYSTRFAMTW